MPLLVGPATESAQLLTMLLIRSNYRTVNINGALFNALGILLGVFLLRAGQRLFNKAIRSLNGFGWLAEIGGG